MIKVSIIVPVYNVEEYLSKCLESLINQTLEEIEIIVVNDGATDNSQRIIDEYMQKSRKIKAFVKTNGGLSDARNFGLTYATGEYIGFVDSDDFVETDMYEVMYKKAKEDDSDIVECNLRHTYPDTEDIEIGKKIYDKKEMLMFGRSVVWNKIYERNWLTDTKVTFLKGLIYEDVAFFLMLIPHIRVYSYVEPAFVHYVQRDSSINNLSSAKTLDILKILKSIFSYYVENGYYDEYKEALEFFFARILLCSSFGRMCRIANEKEQIEAFDKNWSLLVETFPDWKKNKVLMNTKSPQAMFMKTLNKTTYQIYGKLFPILFKAKRYLIKKYLSL